MCEHGNTTTLVLPTPDTDDPSGRGYYLRAWEIDSCIAPLVAALNAAGITTRGSCCGHGKGPCQIVLADGRWMTISTRDAALAADMLPLPEKQPEKS